jgi:general secretion pathway protein N
MKINYSLPGLKFNKTILRNILIVFTLYSIFLIITLPASVVFSTITLPKNITLSAISGTIWSGQAQKLRVSGIELGSVNWELHPLNFIIGELSADISIVNNKQYIKTEINLSSSGKLELQETRFLIDLSSLQPLTYGMPFSYEGETSGYFPVSSFYKNNYVGINGKLFLNNIEMISPQRQSFGDFVVDFRAENEGVTSGRIKDLGGLLNIEGQLNLNKNGQLTFSAQLAAREASSSLAQMLSFLGRKDASGHVQVNNRFKLWR